jgi:hypothetical protein
LVQHINNSIPTEDFGEQWGVEIGQATSLAPDGPKPVLVATGQNRNDVNAAITLAIGALVRYPRVALAIVDHQRAVEFFEAIERFEQQQNLNVVVIRTRDDLASLAYSGRGIVVGRADDLAGLQFEEVVVAGFADAGETERLEHRRFEFMSTLYLAVSRAAIRVSIIVDENDYGMPTVLREALMAGLVTESGNP